MARGRPKGAGTFLELDAPIRTRVSELMAAEPGLAAGDACLLIERQDGKAMNADLRRRIRYYFKNSVPDYGSVAVENGDDEDPKPIIAIDTLDNTRFREALCDLGPEDRAAAVFERQRIIRNYHRSLQRYQKMSTGFTEKEREEGTSALWCVFAYDILVHLGLMMRTINSGIKR